MQIAFDRVLDPLHTALHLRARDVPVPGVDRLELGTIDRHAGLGVEVIAISTDDQERTRQTKESWGLEKVAIGYDLGIEKAREWGLYISSRRDGSHRYVVILAYLNNPPLLMF